MIVDLESWEAGYDDGLLGRPSSGYFQARACRAGTQEDFRLRYTRSSTERAPQRDGGNSRLIII